MSFVLLELGIQCLVVLRNCVYVVKGDCRGIGIHSEGLVGDGIEQRLRVLGGRRVDHFFQHIIEDDFLSRKQGGPDVLVSGELGIFAAAQIGEQDIFMRPHWKAQVICQDATSHVAPSHPAQEISLHLGLELLGLKALVMGILHGFRRTQHNRPEPLSPPRAPPYED